MFCIIQIILTLISELRNVIKENDTFRSYRITEILRLVFEVFEANRNDSERVDSLIRSEGTLYF